MEQIFWFLVIRGGVTYLLHQPKNIWIGGNGKMPNFTSAMINYHQYIKDFEKQSWNTGHSFWKVAPFSAERQVSL